MFSDANDRWALCEWYDYRMPRKRKYLCTRYKHIAYNRVDTIHEFNRLTVEYSSDIASEKDNE